MNAAPSIALRTKTAIKLKHGIGISVTPAQLDEFSSLLYRAQNEHRVDDDEAEHLAACIDAKRPKARTAPAQSISSIGSRVCRRFVPRLPQRSPDRQKSRERRRTLGGSSALPPALRANYTEGHRAVLCVVAEEIKRTGMCDFAIDKIAAMAGVCRTTVQNTLHEARRLGHVSIKERPQRGLKNLTNIVKIVSREWLAWISRGSDALARIGSKMAKIVNPTGINISLEGRFEGAERPCHAPGTGKTAPTMPLSEPNWRRTRW